MPFTRHCLASIFSRTKPQQYIFVVSHFDVVLHVMASCIIFRLPWFRYEQVTG